MSIFLPFIQFAQFIVPYHLDLPKEEVILKDRGATKWGLKDKIEEIAEKGLLPDTLKEASSND